jgi:histidinol-phosphate aminotransferase
MPRSAVRSLTVRPLPPAFEPYRWALSTTAIARIAGVQPDEVLRFDGNTPPRGRARLDQLADAVARVHTYPHGGYPKIHEAIAEYAGVAPENVVLGAGADDLLMLCARTFAGPHDRIDVRDEPVYPVLRGAVHLAGADVGTEHPVATFVCRPHNPTGALVELPAARPLVVDEAYFEYAGGETAVRLVNERVVVIRTFSKAFALAGARIGYAVADADTAAELRTRQSPAPVSTLSVALALGGLAEPPDVAETIAERERVAERLGAIGLEPLPSWTNFVFVPVADAIAIGDALLRQGVAVRASADGIRITVRDARDDDRLVDALESLLESRAIASRL